MLHVSFYAGVENKLFSKGAIDQRLMMPRQTDRQTGRLRGPGRGWTIIYLNQLQQIVKYVQFAVSEPRSSYPILCLLLCLRQGLKFSNWGLNFWSSCRCLLSAGRTDVCHDAQFMQLLGIEPRVWYTLGRHFPNWAKSLGRSYTIYIWVCTDTGLMAKSPWHKPSVRRRCIRILTQQPLRWVNAAQSYVSKSGCICWKPWDVR